jgi:hypothetical protein
MVKKKINKSRFAQCKDKGYRWGIMISNGSEILNRIFKTCRCLPVVAIVNEGKVWSTKVIKKLNKRAKKLRPHMVDPYGSDQGDYEVIHHGEILPNSDFENFKYTVHIKEGMVSKCSCLIRVRKFELNRFIYLCYSAQTLLNTWSERFFINIQIKLIGQRATIQESFPSDD